MINGNHYRRQLLIAPKYESEIEYLESDGYQIMDTDIVLTDYDNTIEARFMRRGDLSDVGKYPLIFGCYTNEQSNAYRIIRYASDGAIMVTNGRLASNGNTNVSTIKNVIYNLKLYPDYGEITGGSYNKTRITYKTTKGNQNTKPFRLFCSKIRLRLYNIKVFKNDVLIMDVVPYRIGLTGFMYDKVSNKLFSNSGTGNFILGPDVNSTIVVTQQQQYSMYSEQVNQLYE